MPALYAILFLLLAFVGTGFLDQNRTSALTLRYFGWESPYWPVGVFLLLAFAAGFLLASLLSFMGDIRSRLRQRRAEREVRRLADEVARLEGLRQRPPEP